MMKPEGAAKEYGGAEVFWDNANGDGIKSGVLVLAKDEATTANPLEGVLNTDRYLHISKDDVLVLKSMATFNKELREKKEADLSERLGVKVIILDAIMEIIGVVEHGGDA